MTQYTRDKQRRLVDLLYKKTIERKIRWVVDNDRVIYATIAGGDLRVFSGINAEGEDLVNFVLIGADGKNSDTFSDETIKSDSIVPEGFENWYLLCSAVLEMGRRQASGSEDVLDAMIDELDDDVPF